MMRGEKRSARRETFPCAAFSTRNPTYTAPGSNLRLGSKMSATNPYGLSACVGVCTYIRGLEL